MFTFNRNKSLFIHHQIMSFYKLSLEMWWVIGNQVIAFSILCIQISKLKQLSHTLRYSSFWLFEQVKYWNTRIFQPCHPQTILQLKNLTHNKNQENEIRLPDFLNIKKTMFHNKSGHITVSWISYIITKNYVLKYTNQFFTFYLD